MPELDGEKGLRVSVEPYGPDDRMLSDAAAAPILHPVPGEHLQGERHRLLSLQLLEEDDKGVEGVPEPSNRLVATVFDNAQDHTVIVGGFFDDLARASATPSGHARPATAAGFEAAAELVLGNATLRRPVAAVERVADALLGPAAAVAGPVSAVRAEIAVYQRYIDAPVMGRVCGLLSSTGDLVGRSGPCLPRSSRPG